ncbi:phage/plasmid primase, P4 family [Neobacillus piezotolerans]|uniref:phage/plasmid primase, P4 family n=1 Tax=Neobacillus piezotolerans TaxID=2259171 RepID=UPI001FE5CC99|nr:phage/plasmid primase, P4 family [Neobacillus piezotolerans]
MEIDLMSGIHAANNLPTEDDVQSILDTFSLDPSIVIHSGGGLHCYWLFDKPAEIRSVKDMQGAERMLGRFQKVFIRLAKAKGLHIDNTADLARVLRVPGTFNLKGEPKPVKTALFEPERRYSLLELLSAIQDIEATFPEETVTKAEKKHYDTEIPDAKHPDRIAKECRFIQDYLNHIESANYSEWMAALSIAAFCEDGDELVHEWSKGHSGYSEPEVDRKYTEIREKMKPRTCQTINQEFGRCNGCKHFNKINSPIALGMERKKKMSAEQSNFKRTDLGNAERLVFRHGSDIRFNSTFGKWYLWDGKRWNEDKVGRILQLAKETVRAIYDEAAKAEDPDTRKSLAEHAVRSESRARIESMVSLAKTEVPTLPEEMDNDIWLFNCENGVIDLKTGVLKPHDRNLMMTKKSSVAYDSKAECPTWLKFLSDIFQDENGKVKHDTINFLQKAVGYSLTGSTREQVLFFLYGTGRNGKSTYMNVIKDILGDYGKQTNADTFTVKKSDRVNNDIAALKGARMVAATESEEGARLAESLVKQLTGGEPVQARFLHQEYFEYVPQFKIFFTTNHKPVIRGNDEGIWRRIRLIPFTVTIPNEKLDKDLPEKLRNEMPGILKWMVEGCLKWQKEGLGVPQEVEEATNSYRDEMDTLGNFITDVCVLHPNVKTLAAELYRQYGYWCQDNGEFEITKQKFNRKLEERGFKKGRDGRGIYLTGIGINISSTGEKVNFYEKKNTNSA